MTGEFGDVGGMLAALKPDEPVYAIRPHELRHTAQSLTGLFPGDIFYAVSANPHSEFLRALHAGGIRNFAVASMTELRAVKDHFPAASCHFVPPVKSAASIREAAHGYGVMHFTADHADELAKIIVHATPLKPTIVIRLMVPENLSAYDQAGKFGCSVAEATALMRAASAEGLGVGLGFHFGAEAPDPAIWRRALDLVGDTIRAASLQPELIDVGGGFPVSRRDNSLPSLADCCNAVREGLTQIRLHRQPRLLCTPGCSLAASGASLVLRVELRRGNRLYLNDGVHGGLSQWRLADDEPPMRVWRVNGNAHKLASALDDFDFYGPTGDTADWIRGPFALPSDIRIGDYIEIGQMGAHSMNGWSSFGGFLPAASVIVNDPALLI